MTPPLMETGIKEEGYDITQAESGIVSRDVMLGENRDEWQDLYRYQVPTGLSYIFSPGDNFSIYEEYLSDSIDLALADDGGSFTDETAANNEATADDITLMPATEVINDAYYWGQRYPFGRLRLTIGTAGVGTAITWEYYNGSAWASISGISDATSGFTTGTSTYNVTFTPPGNWARTTVDGKDSYWIRARVSTASFTTVPTGTQAWINGGSFELKDTDRFRVEVRDPNEMNRTPILNQRRYVQVKEFQDDEKLGSLDIFEEVVARQGMWVVVMVLPSSGIVDVSNGYFALESTRVREGIK